MMREQRLGLALSGGGLRASFFHIGILAALADRDLLRRVEVISTVSGGSIVGALYAIKVKQLLESKADHEITPEDFQVLVADLATQFRRATQKNIRLRALANPFKNARMARSTYSRSDRIGELFDSLLYRPAFSSKRNEPVRMTDLLVSPKQSRPNHSPNGTEGFSPDRGNRWRQTKVPILIINATTLNTGRNWRFEAIRMGEPPRRGGFVSDIDMRMRLERPPSYDVIGTEHRMMRLGHAVAASAAVPAVLHPLAISHLYENVRVELIDGGVHDNQGVGALLDRGCRPIIVSDGSSQMRGEKHPGTILPSVLTRSLEILMCRVREEQLLRAHGSHTKDLYLAHLQKGLEIEHIPYVTADGSYSQDVNEQEKTKAFQNTTGIDPGVQEALAQLRTDLDAFHDAECFSLMAAGYIIAEQEVQSFPVTDKTRQPSPYPWEFKIVEPLLQEPTPEFLKLLKTGSANSFKVFILYPALFYGTVILCLALLIQWVGQYKDVLLQPIIPATWVPSRAVALLVLGGVVLSQLPIRFRFHKLHWVQNIWSYVRAPLRFWGRVFSRAIPSVLASAVAWFSLLVLNPLYLRAGKIDRLLSDRNMKSPHIPERPLSSTRRM